MQFNKNKLYIIINFAFRDKKRRLMDLLPNILYTTKSIASHMYGSVSSSALKRAERWIVEKSINFDCLNVENIFDEHNRPAKIQVMKHLQNIHKKKKCAPIC